MIKSSDSVVTMHVQKRDGSLEPVNVNKIVKAIQKHSVGLLYVDAMLVATKTISGLYNGTSTQELDKLAIRTASTLMVDEPQYSKLAARLLTTYLDKEVKNQDIYSFSQSIGIGYSEGIFSEKTHNFVKLYARKLNTLIDNSRNELFEYFGVATLHDRYLTKHPKTRKVIETPQYFWLRVACGLSDTFDEAKELYHLFSSLEYIPSSPTLFNSGTVHEQMSSCYLLDSPEDSLDGIYGKYHDIARLSKYAGGIGVSYSRVRSKNSPIKGTNGISNGIVPFLKTLDSSVLAVNQGSRRKGAACVYLETWHADIEQFLELRDNTGDESRRTYNLNLANWIPDLFMRRVEQGAMWSLFDPHTVPEFTDTWGTAFEELYVQAEADKKYIKQIPARDLYSRMMRTLAQTGNGWMCFKDISNRKCNQLPTAPTEAVHLSNLCTEVIELNNTNTETSVCNLGSINLSQYVDIEKNQFDFDKLAKNVQVAVRQLDTVIDRNFYPIESAAASNKKWRPVGLGIMGLQDVFFQLGLAFDSPEALAVSTKIQEYIYYNALLSSSKLAEDKGAFPNWKHSHTASGKLQFDLWLEESPDLQIDFSPELDWAGLKQRIVRTGLRNSLLIAIAPTATIASIAGCYECIEPQLSNMFKRESLSGEFIQINRYLVHDLRKLGLWTQAIKNKIKLSDGSIQNIDEIPENIKLLYRTVWELSMKSLIKLAKFRGVFIDQSQSLNIFLKNPNISILSSVYMSIYINSLKTSYYLRSRGASEISKVTVTQKPAYTEEEKLVCSLENPEYCEACQ